MTRPKEMIRLINENGKCKIKCLQDESYFHAGEATVKIYLVNTRESKEKWFFYEKNQTIEFDDDPRKYWVVIRVRNAEKFKGKDVLLQFKLGKKADGTPIFWYIQNRIGPMRSHWTKKEIIPFKINF